MKTMTTTDTKAKTFWEHLQSATYRLKRNKRVEKDKSLPTGWMKRLQKWRDNDGRAFLRWILKILHGLHLLPHLLEDYAAVLVLLPLVVIQGNVLHQWPEREKTTIIKSSHFHFHDEGRPQIWCYLRGIEVCAAVLGQLPLVVIQGDVLEQWLDSSHWRGKRKHF